MPTSTSPTPSPSSSARTAQIKTTGFDVIIPALRAKKCDAIISALTNTPARAKQVNFANYVTVGMLLMVKKGNPSGVTGLASLSGKSVAVAGRDDGEGQARRAEQDVLRSRARSRSRSRSTRPTRPPRRRSSPARSTPTSPTRRPSSTTSRRRAGSSRPPAARSTALRRASRRGKGDPLGPQVKTAIATLYANGTMKTDPREVGPQRVRTEEVETYACSSRSTGTSSGTGSSIRTAPFVHALWTTIYISVISQFVRASCSACSPRSRGCRASGSCASSRASTS